MRYRHSRETAPAQLCPKPLDGPARRRSTLAADAASSPPSAALERGRDGTADEQGVTKVCGPARLVATAVPVAGGDAGASVPQRARLAVAAVPEARRGHRRRGARRTALSLVVIRFNCTRVEPGSQRHMWGREA